jgi:hypothetical protein
MKCGLISRLKVVLLHETKPLLYMISGPSEMCRFDLYFFILTQGAVQEKAKVLQSVRVNDVGTTQLKKHNIYVNVFFNSNLITTVTILQWLENEKQRLGHLRDRASETGRKKEYPFFIVLCCAVSALLLFLVLIILLVELVFMLRKV